MNKFFSHQLFSIGKQNISLFDVVIFIISLVFLYFVIRFISFLIRSRLKNLGKLDGRTLSIVKLIQYCLWIVGISFSVQLIGIDFTFIIASSAALLVGIGLGLQNIFKDFMSGIVILLEGTIKIDDVVEIDGEVVKIQEISLRTTNVFTRNFNTLIIPNHKFVEEKVINWSHNDEPTRFFLDFGVHFDTNPELLKKVVLETAILNPDVIHNERFFPFVRFIDFGTSSLNFQLYFWSTNLFLIENTKSDLRYEILKTFSDYKIKIPYQHIVLVNQEG